MSPNGAWLAYVSNESGDDQVFVRPFPNTEDARFLISTSGGTEPHWAHDGRELFYRNSDEYMVAAELEFTPTFRVAESIVLFSVADYKSLRLHRAYTVTPGDEAFIMIRPVVPQGQDLILVQNFFEELKARVPN